MHCTLFAHIRKFAMQQSFFQAQQSISKVVRLLHTQQNGFILAMPTQ
jgi:hypothetical protein